MVAVGSAVVQSLISTGILLAASLVFFKSVSPFVLLLPLAYVPLVFLTLGLGWFLASLGVYVRDIGQAIGVATQVLFFLSPIFYPVSAVPEHLRFILYANPMTMILTGFRRTLLGGAAPVRGVDRAHPGDGGSRCSATRGSCRRKRACGRDVAMNEPSASDQIVVSVRAVGKVYRLYDHPRTASSTCCSPTSGKLRARVLGAPRRVLRRATRRGRWHHRPERSGKSTLLQIMAGILQPAAGEVELWGRVGALLELGSGFNLDCTGRENVVLNAAILGMSRREIARRADEIVAFADIGEFIDQPVKMYSSGMFVRLAFAVTTSLDADVLLIDEALAVGDVFFRQKCYQRLAALRERGVAIVLVSHALNEVEQFCQRALLLHGGRVTFEGPAIEAVKRYYLIAPEGVAAAGTPLPGEARGGDRRGSGAWPVPEAFLDLRRGPGDERRGTLHGSGAVRRRRKAPPRIRARGNGQLLLRVRAARRRRGADRGRRAGERQGHHRARQEHNRARIRGAAQREAGPAAPGPPGHRARARER